MWGYPIDSSGLRSALSSVMPSSLPSRKQTNHRTDEAGHRAAGLAGSPPQTHECDFYSYSRVTDRERPQTPQTVDSIFRLNALRCGDRCLEAPRELRGNPYSCGMTGAGLAMSEPGLRIAARSAARHPISASESDGCTVSVMEREAGDLIVAFSDAERGRPSGGACGPRASRAGRSSSSRNRRWPVRYRGPAVARGRTDSPRRCRPPPET